MENATPTASGKGEGAPDRSLFQTERRSYEEANDESRLDRMERLLEHLVRKSRAATRSWSRSRSRSRTPPRHRERAMCGDTRAERTREEPRSRPTSCGRSPSRIRPGDEQLIPIFDPANDALTVENWVRHVDDMAARYEWDDRSVMRLIAGRLKGHARQWYDTRQRIASTWRESKVLLVAQFRKTVPFSKLFKEAANYEARPGQALADYCFQKLNKLRKIDIEIRDEYLVDMVIGGIPNENIARAIRSAKLTDANELYAYMSGMGNMPKEEVIRPMRPKIRPPLQVAVASSASASDAVARGPGAQHEKGRRPSCFSCGLPGHLARDCRKKGNWCSTCRKSGHRSEDCKEREQKQGKTDQ